MARQYRNTKKSQYESKVKQLDNLGTDINQFVQKEGLSLIESILGDFIIRVKDNIDNEDLPVTGKISDIEVKAEGNEVNVYAPDYLLFQNFGVNGSEKKLYPKSPFSYTDKRPPVNVFKNWIKRKNINLRNNAKYKGNESPFKELSEDKQIDKAAWGMATKVYKEGFKPRNVYSKEIPQLVEELGEVIADFVLQSVNQVIDVKPSGRRNIVR